MIRRLGLFGLFALILLAPRVLRRHADGAATLVGSASNGADDEVWISVLKKEEGHVDADTYKTYRIPITESFTVIGVHAIPAPGIHHMKLKLHLGKGGGDREFFGYDGISTVCPPPPLRFAELAGAGDVGETLGPGDEWVMEVHNREPMEAEEVGFKVLTVASPLPHQRALVNVGVAVSGFALQPGQERITAGAGGAAGGKALTFEVRGEDCSLLGIHGHFHRRGVEQAFFLNKEELGRWSPEQAPGECPAPPTYLKDAAIVTLGGRNVRQGDVVSTTCTYDTSGDAEAVEDGPAAEDEMCTGFLMYACGAEGPAAGVRSKLPREAAEAPTEALEW